MATIKEVVLEYFPGASDEYIEYILWGHTGYPSFWESEDTEACLRKQLEAFKDEVRTCQKQGS